MKKPNYKKISKVILNKIRRVRFYSKRKNIINKDVTIISNSCLAGVIYNTLNLPFLTPTINLTIKGEGFVWFVNNLKKYINDGYFVDLHKKIGDIFGPYAILRCDGLPDIDVCFTHYRSFEEAVEKWNERAKRINYKKVFVLIEARYYAETKIIEKYESIGFHKVVLTSKSVNNDYIKHLSFYDKKRNESKSVTEFTSIFGKRGIDEYDYVSNIFNITY